MAKALFLRFWRESVIGVLLLVMLGAYNLYYEPKIERLELEVQVQEALREQCRSNFENQTKQILEQSRQVTETTERYFSELSKTLQDIRGRDDSDIDDILDADVPSNIEECIELNEYLIDMVDNLRWGS